MCSHWPRNAVIKGRRKLKFYCLKQSGRYEETNFACCHFQRDFFALLTYSPRNPASSRRPLRAFVVNKFSLQNTFSDSRRDEILMKRTGRSYIATVCSDHKGKRRSDVLWFKLYRLIG